jgi:hypothetical protein
METNTKRLPYGNSNFSSIITENDAVLLLRFELILHKNIK